MNQEDLRNEEQEKEQEETKEPKAKALFVVGEVNELLTKEFLKNIFETDWIKDNYKELTIYISSEGGSLPCCFAMIDAIDFVREAFGVHVTTFGLGEAASAGFFLLCAGDNRGLFPNCNVFVHEHQAYGADPASYSERKLEEKDQDRLYNQYINYTANRLGISRIRVKRLLKKNRYLRESELANYNIITKST